MYSFELRAIETRRRVAVAYKAANPGNYRLCRAAAIAEDKLEACANILREGDGMERTLSYAIARREEGEAWSAFWAAKNEREQIAA